MNKFFVFTVLLSAIILLADAGDGEASGSDGDLPELKIEVLHVPVECEEKSAKGHMLSMHYKGTMDNGVQFDSTYESGKPFKFQVGVGQVAQGWDLGLLDMCVGEKRRLTVPPHLGYRESDTNRSPGGATLHFEIELVAIEPAPPEHGEL